MLKKLKKLEKIPGKFLSSKKVKKKTLKKSLSPQKRLKGIQKNPIKLPELEKNLENVLKNFRAQGNLEEIQKNSRQFPELKKKLINFRAPKN